jgi:hypothetical protein
MIIIFKVSSQHRVITLSPDSNLKSCAVHRTAHSNFKAARNEWVSGYLTIPAQPGQSLPGASRTSNSTMSPVLSVTTAEATRHRRWLQKITSRRKILHEWHEVWYRPHSFNELSSNNSNELLNSSHSYKEHSIASKLLPRRYFQRERRKTK